MLWGFFASKISHLFGIFAGSQSELEEESAVNTYATCVSNLKLKKVIYTSSTLVIILL